MAKLTQFGRMRRRIKRELEAAREENARAIMQTAARLAAGAGYVAMIKSAIVTQNRMLAAWKWEQTGEKLPEDEPHKDGIFE